MWPFVSLQPSYLESVEVRNVVSGTVACLLTVIVFQVPSFDINLNVKFKFRLLKQNFLTVKQSTGNSVTKTMSKRNKINSILSNSYVKYYF